MTLFVFLYLSILAEFFQVVYMIEDAHLSPEERTWRAAGRNTWYSLFVATMWPVELIGQVYEAYRKRPSVFFGKRKK